MLPLYQVARKPDLELYASGASRFPYLDAFQIRQGVTLSAAAVTAALSPLLTDERLTRFASVCRGGASLCIYRCVNGCFPSGACVWRVCGAGAGWCVCVCGGWGWGWGWGAGCAPEAAAWVLHRRRRWQLNPRHDP